MVLNITESKNCVIVDATCRNGPNNWRLYDVVFYDFDTGKPLVSRFNSDGSAEAIHHVTLVDDGSPDSQMMRFARAIDKVSAFEDFKKIDLESSNKECEFLKGLGVSVFYNDAPRFHDNNTPYSFACYKRNEVGKVVPSAPYLDIYSRDKRVGFGENYELDSSIKGVYWSDIENTVRSFEYDKDVFKDRLEENNIKHSYLKISDFEIKKIYTASPNDQPVWDDDARYDQYHVTVNGKTIFGFEDSPKHVIKSSNSVIDYKTNHAVLFENGKVYFTKFHDEIDDLLNYEDKSYWALDNVGLDSTERYFGKRSLNVSSLKFKPIEGTQCFGLYINDKVVSIGDVKYLDSYHGGYGFFNPDENVGFIFEDDAVSRIEGLNSYKDSVDDFDEHGFNGIVNDLMTNDEYSNLVEKYQDLEYAIANLRENQMMDVSKSENENKVFSSIDYDDFDF